jgi:hypothetical protein
MNVIAIVLFLIILTVLIYTYYYFNPTLLNNGDVIDLSQNPQFSIGLDDDNAKSIRYYYDGWLRVDRNPDQSQTYAIFNRGNDFIVGLKGHRLSILYGHKRDGDSPVVASKTGIVDASAYVMMDIARNFPFQKWTYFCINVDGNTMDTYLDGKLTKSISLPVPPASPPIQKPAGGNYNGTSDAIQFTQFSASPSLSVGNASLTGKIARFRRDMGNMNPQDVWNTYILGPGVVDADEAATGDYHARISLTKNNTVKRSLNLF